MDVTGDLFLNYELKDFIVHSKEPTSLNLLWHYTLALMIPHIDKEWQVLTASLVTKRRPLLIWITSNLRHRAWIVVFFYGASYHKILNVLLHQVVLGGHQHWPPKGVQVCIVQLVWHATDFVRCIHMNVSEKIRQRYRRGKKISSPVNAPQRRYFRCVCTDLAPSGRMIFTVISSITWSSYTWSTSLIFNAYWSPGIYNGTTYKLRHPEIQCLINKTGYQKSTHPACKGTHN